MYQKLAMVKKSRLMKTAANTAALMNARRVPILICESKDIMLKPWLLHYLDGRVVNLYHAYRLTAWRQHLRALSYFILLKRIVIIAF